MSPFFLHLSHISRATTYQNHVVQTFQKCTSKKAWKETSETHFVRRQPVPMDCIQSHGLWFGWYASNMCVYIYSIHVMSYIPREFTLLLSISSSLVPLFCGSNIEIVRHLCYRMAWGKHQECIQISGHVIFHVSSYSLRACGCSWCSLACPESQPPKHQNANQVDKEKQSTIS